MGCDRNGIRQVLLGRWFLQEPPEKTEEGAAGGGIVGASARIANDVVEPGGDRCSAAPPDTMPTGRQRAPSSV